MLEIADSFLLGTYRKVAKGRHHVTRLYYVTVVTSQLTTFNMLFHRQFLTELDHLFT